jgi:uncharacterized integral membrane protein
MSGSEQSSGGQRPGGEGPSSRERARTLGLVIAAIIMTLFAVLNTEEVKVNWIVSSSRAPVIIVIIVSLLVGAVLS